MHQANPTTTQTLLDNYLTFTEWHRSRVTRRPGAVLAESDEPDFTWALLDEAPAADYIERFRTIRLPPWSTTSQDVLAPKGYRPTGGLTFMTRPHHAPPLRPSPSMEVTEARTEQEMDRFTEVQTDGFLTDGEDRERWRAFLGSANRANLGCAQQRFLIGWLDGRAVGVTLLLSTRDTAGVYAVATLPEHRGRGVASALVAHAATAAHALGCTTLSLQVLRGSYAESLYRKHGFVEAFTLETLQR